MFIFLAALAIASPFDDASAYLLLGDPRSALAICDEVLEKEPENEQLQIVKIRALAKAKDKDALFAAYKKLSPELQKNEEVLDALAWGVIHWGASSSREHLRRMALICAGITRRETGVVVVEEMLRDKSVQLRAISAHFSGTLRDERLAKACSKQLTKERSGLVRPELIRALGAMGARSALAPLKELMRSPTLSSEESLQAQIACQMIGKEEHDKELLGSPAPALRAYACRLTQLEGDMESMKKVRELVEDPQKDVRTAALWSLYTLSYEPDDLEIFKKAALKALGDSHTDVQLIAAKVLMPYGEAKAAQKLLYLIQSDQLDLARRAAGVLAASGAHAKPYFIEAFARAKDPLIRLNLSQGMLLHSIDLPLALGAIEHILTHPHIKLRQVDIGGAGRMYTEALGAFDFQTEEGDLAHRLELLDQLAQVDAKRAHKFAECLLKPRQWGSLFSLASTYLKQQPDHALDLLATHLDNPDWAIRVQAALLLAHLRDDPKARQVLIECYHDTKAPRSAKLGILEGMLQIDARGHLPFFISLLDEPYEALQIVASGCIVAALDR